MFSLALWNRFFRDYSEIFLIMFLQGDSLSNEAVSLYSISQTTYT